jgi:hypothetical protein
MTGKITNGRYTATTPKMNGPAIIDVKDGMFRVVGYIDNNSTEVLCSGHCDWVDLSRLSSDSVVSKQVITSQG